MNTREKNEFNFKLKHLDGKTDGMLETIDALKEKIMETERNVPPKTTGDDIYDFIKWATENGYEIKKYLHFDKECYFSQYDTFNYTLEEVINRFRKLRNNDK